MAIICGFPVNENLAKKANELEEDIIKKEILPVLSKTIEPALLPVKRELVLVVAYFSLFAFYNVLFSIFVSIMFNNL